MANEFERSYVFAYDDIHHIIKFLGANIENFVTNIQDNYLNPNLRIRFIKQNDIIKNIQLTRKTGNKKNNKRTEENCTINKDTAKESINE